MSAQLTYSYSTTKGIAGGIVDINAYEIDTRINEEDSGKMNFGIGVVKGTVPGVDVKLPTSETAIGDFEGITNNNLTTELDEDGNLNIRRKADIAVMKYGRIYGRVYAPDDTYEPKYGDAVYLITKEAGYEGYFCTSAGAAKGIAIKARFLNIYDAGAKIAAIELYNQAQE